ncbi:MAG TPA: hypothetical protein EYN51_00235 [Flavobacteriales bacterium]|nr:hypothetical protein [Flavobacteriales bacterium]HIB01992.1 hypothetical protein [Phycisphaerales bacterium]
MNILTKMPRIALALVFSASLLSTTGYSQHGENTDTLERGSDLTKKLKSMEARKEVYLDLIESYSAEGHYEKAYANQLLYSQVKDSLFDEDKSKEIGKLEAKYEMERTIEEEKLKKNIRLK